MAETNTNTLDIHVLDGGSTFEARQTSATTVGELRKQYGWDGTISVSGTEAKDDTHAIREGDYVAHVKGNKTGGC
jgi:hypothetical protein